MQRSCLRLTCLTYCLEMHCGFCPLIFALYAYLCPCPGPCRVGWSFCSMDGDGSIFLLVGAAGADVSYMNGQVSPRLYLPDLKKRHGIFEISFPCPLRHDDRVGEDPLLKLLFRLIDLELQNDDDDAPLACWYRHLLRTCTCHSSEN